MKNSDGCTLIFGGPEQRRKRLRALVQSAHEAGRPFLWLLGGESLPPGETLPLSLRKPPARPDSFEAPSIFNGYRVDRQLGIKTLIGGFLNTQDASSLADLILPILFNQNEQDEDRGWSLIVAILFFLTWRRSFHEILSWERISQVAELPNIQEALDTPDLPANIKSSLQAYLRSIPGYLADLSIDKQPLNATEYHGKRVRPIQALANEWCREIDNWDRLIVHMQAPILPYHIKKIASDWSSKHAGGVLILDELGEESNPAFLHQFLTWQSINEGQQVEVVLATGRPQRYPDEDRAILERQQIDLGSVIAPWKTEPATAQGRRL